MKSLPPPLLCHWRNFAFFSVGGGDEVEALCRFTVMGYIVYRFQLAGKIMAIIVMNIAHFGILYFCRTDRMPDRDSPAFIQLQTYTLHVHTSHCWWRKEIHPAPPYVWQWTARLYCWWWKEMYTSYTSIMHCWQWKGIHSGSAQYILLAKGCGGESDTPYTSTGGCCWFIFAVWCRKITCKCQNAG